QSRDLKAHGLSKPERALARNVAVMRVVAHYQGLGSTEGQLDLINAAPNQWHRLTRKPSVACGSDGEIRSLPCSHCCSCCLCLCSTLQAVGVTGAQDFGFAITLVVIAAALVLSGNPIAIVVMVVATALAVIAGIFRLQQPSILDVFLKASAWMLMGLALMW